MICPTCGSRVIDHCNEVRCGWVRCARTDSCGTFGDPVKDRWWQPSRRAA